MTSFTNHPSTRLATIGLRVTRAALTGQFIASARTS